MSRFKHTQLLASKPSASACGSHWFWARPTSACHCGPAASACPEPAALIGDAPPAGSSLTTTSSQDLEEAACVRRPCTEW